MNVADQILAELAALRPYLAGGDHTAITLAAVSQIEEAVSSECCPRSVFDAGYWSASLFSSALAGASEDERPTVCRCLMRIKALCEYWSVMSETISPLDAEALLEAASQVGTRVSGWIGDVAAGRPSAEVLDEVLSEAGVS